MKQSCRIELFADGRRRDSIDAQEILDAAETVMRERSLSRQSAIESALHARLTKAGFRLVEAETKRAVAQLDNVRRGERIPTLQIQVEQLEPSKRGPEDPVSAVGTPTEAFFELERLYPDPLAHDWYASLVGLDDHKERLLVELELLLYPERLEAWSRTHHKRVLDACHRSRNRVPLVLLSGDVGTGKTALAETVGDALALHVKGRVRLLKLNTQVRGTGLVGEMSDLIARAFAAAVARSRASDTPVLLLIDEADALASSRSGAQMHHEDKAGLNTLLQRLDGLRLERLPIAALFITNRPEALDPAVRRRAALELTFERPNAATRAQMFRTILPELDLPDEVIARLDARTGAEAPENGSVPFTASDITDRLLATALRAAYRAHRPLGTEDLFVAADSIRPAPRCETT
jgi:AAA+ superfamily predicted ATPase